MSLGLFDDRNRRRRRRVVLGTALRWLVVLLVAVGVGFWAHDIGSDIARKDVERLEAQVRQLNDENARLRNDVAGLNAALRTERDRVAEWQGRYDADVPTNEEQRLLDAARERVAAGVPVVRLTDVVSIARDTVDCRPLGEPRRFVVQNPIYRGANDSVTFAGNAVTVTARGESALAADGRPQAWFDPAQPVTVTFAHPGGESSQVEGLLPLQHSVTAGESEYRFALVAGARSFIQVSGEVCPYP